MRFPIEDLEPYNQVLIGLEQKLLAVYRKGFPLDHLLADDSLRQLWSWIDRSPYQAVSMARIKSSHAMTPRHALNVMLLARAWAISKHKLGRRLDDFSVAALCHDLGHWQEGSLIYVFDHFTHSQCRQLHDHPILDEETRAILGEPIVTWIRQHHEQPNGKGYPDGLKDTELEMLSQALRILDCYEGLTTARRFRPRYTPKEAFELMYRWSGSAIHAGLFLSFRRFLGDFPIGSFVILKDGERGVVLPPADEGARVLKLSNAQGDSLEHPESVTLGWGEIQAESPSWHRPELPAKWRHLRPDLLDLPRAY